MIRRVIIFLSKIGGHLNVCGNLEKVSKKYLTQRALYATKIKCKVKSLLKSFIIIRLETDFVFYAKKSLVNAELNRKQ